MHVLRPLLFLLCWLSALLPRADANGTAPTASDFPMLLSTLKDGGNLYAPEFLRRVLVRQNPWSKFDPEGLLEVDLKDEAAAKLKPVNNYINDAVNHAIGSARKAAAEKKLEGDAAAKTVTKGVADALARPLNKIGFIEDTNDIKLSRDVSKLGKDFVLKNEGGGKYKGAIWIWAAQKARLGDALAAGINIEADGKSQAIGTDKLDHFVVEGYTGYENFGNDIRAGRKLSTERENGVFGMGTSGVFSNADIEANVSGQIFFHKLGDAVRDNKEFRFDIKDYSPAKWNENTNPNRYRSDIQAIVEKNFQSTRSR